MIMISMFESMFFMRKRNQNIFFSPSPGDITNSIHTFTGKEYFTYDLSQSPISSSEDAIQLYFKTAYPSGLIFHIGTKSDYISLGLNDGKIKCRLNLGDGKDVNIVVEANPKGSSFNDDRWHFVQITRDYRNVSMNG